MEIKPEYKYRVGNADYSTGIVMKKDGEIFLNSQDNIESEMYHNFEDFQNAKNFAIKKVKENPQIECFIIDELGKHIITFDLNGERK